MTYDSGNTFEGTFFNDKYDGDNGIYKWSDGDEYVGQWKVGERHGIGMFRTADGSVEYSMYEHDVPVGEGVAWSSDMQTAYRLIGGEKGMEILLEEAEALAKEKFGLRSPSLATGSLLLRSVQEGEVTSDQGHRCYQTSSSE